MLCHTHYGLHLFYYLPGFCIGKSGKANRNTLDILIYHRTLTSIHPSLPLNQLNPFWGHGVCWSLSQLLMGKGAVQIGEVTGL